MTTIAFDGRFVVGDRQATNAGGAVRRVGEPKVRRVGRFVYGGIGDMSDVEAVFEWLGGGASEPRPSLEEGGGYGIAVDEQTGVAYYVEGKRPVLLRIHGKFAAAGSGRDVAWTVMRLGGTARQAIKLAMEYDVFTGIGVDAVKVVRRS